MKQKQTLELYQTLDGIVNSYWDSLPKNMQEELKKCHQKLCEIPGNEGVTHEDCADPILGYPFLSPPFGIIEYIRRK